MQSFQVQKHVCTIQSTAIRKVFLSLLIIRLALLVMSASFGLIWLARSLPDVQSVTPMSPQIWATNYLPGLP